MTPGEFGETLSSLATVEINGQDALQQLRHTRKRNALENLLADGLIMAKTAAQGNRVGLYRFATERD